MPGRSFLSVGAYYTFQHSLSSDGEPEVPLEIAMLKDEYSYMENEQDYEPMHPAFSFHEE
jgi:hypothetical protein